MKALITGGGGQLASDLVSVLGSKARAFTHAELDITDTDQLDRAFAEVDPDIVINCAAFHNVDVCEIERARAWQVNVEAVREIASRSPMLVHLSTNYVFDGVRPQPYGEFALPSPRSAYALTKLAGEHAALAYGRHALVVRTAGLYGLQGSASKGGNFVQRMVARALDLGELRMVSDQRLQPTFTADLAAAVLSAVECRATGVVHLTAAGDCSWLEFTEEIMRLASIDVPIHPVSTAIPPGGAGRPLNGVLARPRADALGLAALRDWQEGLADYMSRAGLVEPALLTPTEGAA